MEIGVRAAASGRLATPSAVRAIARAAEQVGYASLWAIDPPDASPPTLGRGWLDAALVLASSAACTDVVRLGWALDLTRHAPGSLVPVLGTLAVLGDGRLTLGLGPAGERLDAALGELPAGWHPGPEAATCRPRLLLATHARGASPAHAARDLDADLDRIGRRADGWIACGNDPEALRSGWAKVRTAAAAAGRDPSSLRLVVPADVSLTDRPLEAGRATFHGSLQQVVDDLEAVRAAGAHEVVLGLVGDHGVDEALATYARVAEAVEAASRLARTHRTA